MKGGKQALWEDGTLRTAITCKLSVYRKPIRTNRLPDVGTNDAYVPRRHIPVRRQSGMGPRGDALLQFDWTVAKCGSLERQALLKTR